MSPKYDPIPIMLQSAEDGMQYSGAIVFIARLTHHRFSVPYQNMYIYIYTYNIHSRGQFSNVISLEA